MKNRAGSEAGGFSEKRFGLRRRGPNAPLAKIGFLDRVIMQARAPISTFSLFCVFMFFLRGDLDCAGVAQTHIPVKTHRFAVFWTCLF